jgi:hypothetical protein
MLLKLDQLVPGKCYRLICADEKSACHNAILRLDSGKGGTVIHPGHAAVSSQKGRNWGFIVSDLFEELTEEEEIVYRLAD